MQEKDIIKVDEKNLLFIKKTQEAIHELLPGKLPIEVQAVLQKMKFIEAREQAISSLVARFPNNTKAIGSIIINNALIGLTYNEDYWITPQGKVPLFQFQAKGLTKLLQTHCNSTIQTY